MTPQKTRATLKLGPALLQFAIGLAVLGAGVYFFYSVWSGGPLWKWLLAIVFSLGGLLAAASAFMRTAPCPSCGRENLLPEKGQHAHCLKCQRYLESDGEYTWLTAEDTIADAPTFGAALPDRFGWPDGCCVCGNPETRPIEVTLHVKQTGKNIATSAAGLALGKIVVQSGGGTLVKVNVPHCSQHMDGAALEDQTVGPTRILFRSYPYQQAFRTRNKVKVE